MQQRVLGGETGRRGFLGGSRSKTRLKGIIIVVISMVVLVLMFQMIGVVLWLALTIAVFIFTMDTESGSPLERRLRRWQWRERKRKGLTVFRPVRDRPDYLTPKDKEWAFYRDWPDGAEGADWLQTDPNLPGIGWHTPKGEQSYLTVVWSVSGQMRGIRGDEFVEKGMSAFSNLLGRYAPRKTLPVRVQLLTRVIPADPTLHRAWTDENLDEDPPKDLVDSYAEVTETVTNDAPTQRHMVVVRWPIDSAFTAKAAEYGPGLDGWRTLMRSQIRMVTGHLQVARLGDVRVLSAAGIAGVLRHMQLPDWPIDRSGDADVACPWLPSHETKSGVMVTAEDPNGVQRSWIHRTASVPVKNVSTEPRTPWWWTALLSELDLNGEQSIIRTISVQLEMEPAQDARKAADDDATADKANQISKQKKGQLTDADTDVSLNAAQQRRKDLRPNSGYVGLGWGMHIAIAAPTAKATRAAADDIESAVHEAGITALDWEEMGQAITQAYTWPLTRGMKPLPVSTGAMVRGRVGGRQGEELPGENLVSAK